MTDPKTPAELSAEIAQTRQDLGETVSALAAKADVKARVSEGASNVAQKAANATEKVTEKAMDTTKDVADRVAQTTKDVTTRAAEKTAEVTKNAAAEVSLTAENLAEMAGKGMERVRRNPMPVVLGAVAALVAIVLFRKRRSR